MSAITLYDQNGRPLPISGKSRTVKNSNYIGADNGRIHANWNASRDSADSAISWERRTLIQRTHERMRNDPSLKGMVRTLYGNVIGKGIRTESELDSDALGLSDDQTLEYESLIDEEWRLWGQECDYSGNEARRLNFFEIQQALFITHLLFGETFVLPRYVRRPWASYSLCLQLVDPERIVSPNTNGTAPWQWVVNAKTGNEVRDGIEIGKRGEVVAIHIANKHPGDAFTQYFSDTETMRLPAYNRYGTTNFWHTYKWFRLEATRGEPGLAACLTGSRHLGEYIGNELLRAEMAAMLGLVFTQEDSYDTSQDLDEDDRVGTEQEKEREQIELYAGMVNYAPKGFKANVVNPNIPGNNFDSFVERIATLTGRPLGLVRELVLGSFDKSNFSNTRAALQMAQRDFEAERQWFISKEIEPVRERVLQEAVIRGRLSLPGFDDPRMRREWLRYRSFGPPWPYLEPVKDETARKMRLEQGTSTLADECTALDKRWRRNVRQRAKEQAYQQQQLKEFGVKTPEEKALELQNAKDSKNAEE